MVLNNLFYITAKFSDEHPKETEELWATLCGCWPNNLKVIIRYLIIVSGMAPQELLPYVSETFNIAFADDKMNKNIQSLGKACGIVSGTSPSGSSCRRNDDGIRDGRDPELFD